MAASGVPRRFAHARRCSPRAWIRFAPISLGTIAAAILLQAPAARAACDPPAVGAGDPTPTNVVFCSGATVNQNDPDGYGTGTNDQTELTIIIEAAASVTGTNHGFNLGADNVIVNSGAITGTTAAGVNTTGAVTVNNLDPAASLTGSTFGIVSTATAVVDNAGTITSTGGTAISAATAIVINSGTIQGQGAVGDGILATSANVDNTGMISGVRYGINATDVTLTNTASVTGGIAGINASGPVTVNNNAPAATITGSTFAIVSADVATIDNAGTVTATAGTAVSAATASVINSGTIQGQGATGDGIVATSANVDNSGTISGVRYGINATDVTLTNTASVTGGTVGINATGAVGITNSGTISGNQGIVSIGGASTVTNSGTITGTGGNAINFGAGNGNTLTLTATSVINGTVTGTGAGNLLQLGGSATGTFNVSAIGAGQQYQGFGLFEKVGSSTWTLTGSGAQNWTITAGTLIGDTTSIQGSLITNNAALVFDQASGGTYAGVISGSGSLTKQGDGTLTLTGTNTYGGPTTVNAGILNVNGSIANSSTLVNNGGTLAGIGTVGATTIAGGGVFAPGSGVAGSAMTVAGSLFFQSGAIYRVQVDPSAASIANVSGGATLTGASVQAVFAPGSYLARTYTILSTGGLGGTSFAGVSGNVPAGFAASLSYSPTDVILNLDALLATTGLNQNQQNVADAINTFFNNGGALPPAFVNVFGLTGGTLANALTQLSGEAATGSQQGAFLLTSQFLGLMLDPFVDGRNGGFGGLGAGPAIAFSPERQALPPEVALAYASVFKAPVTKVPAFEQRWNVWGGAYGGYGRTGGDPAGVGSNDLSARAAGFAAGLDYRVGPGTVVGFALAGGGTNWGLAQGLGGGKSDAFQAGIYAATRSGPIYLAASLAFAQHWMSTDRQALGEHLTTSFDAQSFGGRIEGGYRLATPLGGVSPYAALQAQSFHTPRYGETGAGPGGFALAYDARTGTHTRSELGARFDHAIAIDAATLITLRGRLAWAHDWVSDPTLTATFQALPGASFIVNGATPAQDSALVSAGAELRLANGITLGGKFDGEFARQTTVYAGTGTLRVAW